MAAPKRDGGRAEAELLRPAAWLDQRGVTPDGQVDIEVPECGIAGLADVLEVGPCPPIEPGPGRVVTATFRHESAGIVDVSIAGLDEPLGTTANHPFWSEEAQDFVRADQLRPGDRVRTLAGLAHVTAITERGPPETVYNLEVHVDHVYHVGTTGVLVHNGGSDLSCPKLVRVGDLKPIDGPAHAAPRPNMQSLSDGELLQAARVPNDGKGLVRNARTGVLYDGNGRAHELLRRARDPNSTISPDDLVPIRDLTPDHSMFWDVDD